LNYLILFITAQCIILIHTNGQSNLTDRLSSTPIIPLTIVDVEPLIINDDLVIDGDEDEDEDNSEHESVAKVEKEERFSPKAMPLTMLLLFTTFVVAVLGSTFCPECFAPVADLFDGITQSTFAKGVILMLALFSASEIFLCSSDGQLGGLVEFCWSLLVLFIICTGMYYTYDLEWAKSAEDN
jgi:hypothetical protein